MESERDTEQIKPGRLQKSQSEEHRLGGKEAGEIMIAHGGSVVC